MNEQEATLQALQSWLVDGAPVPPEIVEKLKRQNIGNIIMRANSGQPLTAQQVKMLDQIENPTNSTIPSHVNVDTVARCLGCHERRVHQLVEEGVISRIGKGKYPFPDVISRYIDHLRSREAPHGLKEREMQLKCEKLEQDIHRRHEDVRHQVQRELTCEVIEGMQIIRDAYLKIKLPAKTVTQLRKAFEKAMQVIENAKPQMDD